MRQFVAGFVRIQSVLNSYEFSYGSFSFRRSPEKCVFPKKGRGRSDSND